MNNTVRNLGLISIGVLTGILVWSSLHNSGSGIYNDSRSGIQWQFSDAAARGDIQQMEKLYAAGASIDAVPMDDAVSGMRALQAAATRGEARSVKWLLDHGADPNKHESDTNPYLSAQYRMEQSSKVMELLVEHGAKPGPYKADGSLRKRVTQ